MKKHASTILTILGSLGVLATLIAAAKVAPKATQILDCKSAEKFEREGDGDLTPVEVIKHTWRCYIPAIGIGAATIVCIFGANVMSKRQQATLISAYAFLDRSYKTYRSKIRELYGDEADSTTKTEVAKDTYEKDHPDIPSDGETLLFYEEHYGKYFERKMIEVVDAEYQLNRKLAKEGEVSLNDFFHFLGLKDTATGDRLGWSQEIICDFYNPSWIDFEHQLVKMDDGMECYIINMLIEPSADYD